MGEHGTALARAGAFDRRRGRTDDASDGRERENEASSGQQQRAARAAHAQGARMRVSEDALSHPNLQLGGGVVVWAQLTHPFCKSELG